MGKPRYRVDYVATALQCGPEQDEIISALAERDYRIFEVEQPAGALVPYHAHDEEEALILLEGRMQFNVEEELVLLEKGEMITIRADAVHAAATVGAEPAKLLLAFGGDGENPAREMDWDGDEEEDFG